MIRQADSFSLWRFVWHSDFEQYRWRPLVLGSGSNSSPHHWQRLCLRLICNSLMTCLILHLYRDKLAIFGRRYLINCYFGRGGRDIHILTLSTKRKKKQKRESHYYYFDFSPKNHDDYKWYRSGDYLQLSGFERNIALFLSTK